MKTIDKLSSQQICVLLIAQEKAITLGRKWSNIRIFFQVSSSNRTSKKKTHNLIDE